MRERVKFLRACLVLGDILIMYFALFLTLAIRLGNVALWLNPQVETFVIQFSVLHAFWALLLSFLDFYEVSRIRLHSLFKNLTVFLLLAVSLGSIYFYFQPETPITPRTILFLDVLFLAVFLLIWRVVFTRFLKNIDLKEKVVIVEFDSRFSNILKKVFLEKGYELSLIYNSFISEKLNQSSFLAKFGATDSIEKLKKIVKEQEIETIVFGPDFSKNEQFVKQIFSSLPLNLRFINLTNFLEDSTGRVLPESADELWFLENMSGVEKKIEQIIKRGFDIVFSLIGIFFSLLLFPFIALAIKLDSKGPLLFSQERAGRNGKTFVLHKFRSMVPQSPELWREKKKDQVTKVGRILRDFHLDELPQFINILKGDISFVGPRPEWTKLARIFEKEIPFYSLRYIVRPGLTGWAQLNFPASKSVEEAKEKFQYDLYYIKNRSFLFDLGIILKTIRLFF